MTLDDDEVAIVMGQLQGGLISTITSRQALNMYREMRAILRRQPVAVRMAAMDMALKPTNGEVYYEVWDDAADA